MLRRRLIAVLLTVPMLLGGCVAHLVPEGRFVEAPSETARSFIMPDGTALKYRVWEPDGESPGHRAGAARDERQPRRLGVSG